MNEMRTVPLRRLLKFINIFAIGGTERQFVLTTEGIDRTRFDLHLACLQREGQLLDRVERLGFPLVEYRTESLLSFRTLREQLRFAGYLRRNAIDVVHTYNFYPNVFAIPAARLVGVRRIVASVRDTGAYLTTTQMRAQAIACRMADAIVANAEAVRRWLVSHGHRPEKITVIHNGIDVAAFEGAEPTGALHASLGVPRDVPLVGSVSRMSPVKGLHDFITAAADVSRSHPRARFVILGGRFDARDEACEPEIRYRRELEDLAAGLGIADRVLFAGYRTDVAEVLPDLSVSVLSSLTEGLPNAVLESMAAGVPVVATRVGGVPEAVEDEENGWLVPPGEPKALASAIGSALSERERARDLASAARRTVRERFSLEHMVQRTEELYLQLDESEVKSHARR